MTPMVIWIIGLSGSGKSTVGRIVCEELKKKKPNTVFLDGDLLRRTISSDLGYSEADRRVSEFRRSRLCQLLAEQEIQVVCSAISNCPDIRQWCRENIPGYLEVYIKAPQDLLRRRDVKGLYSASGKSKSPVVGIDIPFQEPLSSDLVIDAAEGAEPALLARRILEQADLMRRHPV